MLAALRSFFPCFSVLRYYSWRRDLLRDVVVGLTVCVMQVCNCCIIGEPVISGL